MLTNTELLQNVQLVMQLLDHSARSLTEKHGLSQAEANVLMFLVNNPGKDTATDIVELRMLPKANVSKAVDGLIQKKLLLRRPDTADRRRVHLVLTPAGAALTAEVQAVKERFLDDLFFGFTSQQRDQYATLNARIAENARTGKEVIPHMQQSNQFLGTDPIPRLLRRLAVPTVTAQLINMLYNIVDRIYIGHMPVDGALALTGVGVCMPVIMIVAAFASLVASGGAPRASIATGRGDEEEAQKILGSSFLFQVLISLLLSAVLLVWGRPVLLAFGASENTIGYATDYLSIYALGTLFVQLTLGMNAFITAQGFTKISMVSVVIGAVCNIVLDPIFIYAFGMGVRGAALATILSQAVSCCWVLVFLTGKKTLLRLQRRNLRLSPRILLPCLALGLAPFIMGASESVIAVCYNSSLLAAGGDIAVGAMTILTSVMQFALLPLQGLGQGAQPIASYNYGAKNPQRVRATFWLLLKVSLLYSAVFWALLMLAPQVFVGMFTADAALAAFTINAMRVYFAVLLVFGLQVACQMTFIAIGSAKASITVAVMRKFVLLIPLIYLLPRLFSAAPTTAIYAAEPVADLLAVTFTAVLFGIQFKKSMKKLESERQAPAAQ